LGPTHYTLIQSLYKLNLVSEQQQNLLSRFWFIVRSSPPDRCTPLLPSSFRVVSFSPSSLTCLSASPSLLTMDNQELQHGAAVAPISQSSLAAATASIVPMNSSLDTMNRSAIIPLSNTQQVISLRLSNTNFLYWRMQMKPFLLGQGVYSFVDGTSPCPPSHLYIYYNILTIGQSFISTMDTTRSSNHECSFILALHRSAASSCGL